jgi:hypothetical protein
MKDKLNRLDAVLNELQMDEYLNEDSLPKIGKARGLVNELVKNCSIPLVMPCTSFEHTAVDLKDGSTAVWTDGLSLNSDNDRHCHYKLEEGQKYKVVVYKA